MIHESIVLSHRLKFYPSVFDSVDCQLAKLYMTSLCADTSEDLDGKDEKFTCMRGSLENITFSAHSMNYNVILL